MHLYQKPRRKYRQWQPRHSVCLHSDFRWKNAPHLFVFFVDMKPFSASLPACCRADSSAADVSACPTLFNTRFFGNFHRFLSVFLWVFRLIFRGFLHDFRPFFRRFSSLQAKISPQNPTKAFTKFTNYLQIYSKSAYYFSISAIYYASFCSQILTFLFTMPVR